MYKTPSNGYKEYKKFADKTSYYWEKREPVHHKSVKKYAKDYAENCYNKEFQVCYSKNNHHRHPKEREYFDRPVTLIDKGYISSPRHKLPLDVTNFGNIHYNFDYK